MSGEKQPDGNKEQDGAAESDTRQKTAPNHQKTILLFRFWRSIRRKRVGVPPANTAEKITVFLTSVLICVGLLQAAIYNQQKKIMASSGAQTDKLIAAAEIQAQAARSNAASASSMAHSVQEQADYAHKIADQTLSQATATKRLAEQAALSAGAAQKQSSNTELIATETKHNADTAAKELEMSERPWLDANITPDGPFEFNVNGASIHVRILVRNSGHSPAQFNINPVALFGAKASKASEYRNQACADSTRILTTMPNFGMTLFLNYPFEQQMSVGIAKEEIENGKGSKEFPGSNFGDVMLSPALVVCIAYRPAFNSTSVYHTAYIVDLFQHDPQYGISSLFKIGEDVDQKNLTFRLHPFDSVVAD
jgi:hypothetical protein